MGEGVVAIYEVDVSDSIIPDNCIGYRDTQYNCNLYAYSDK